MAPGCEVKLLKSNEPAPSLCRSELLNAYTTNYLLLFAWKQTQSLHFLYFPLPSFILSRQHQSSSFEMHRLHGIGFMDVDVFLLKKTCGLPLEKSGAALILWALVHFRLHFPSFSRMVTGIGSGECLGQTFLTFCFFQNKGKN